MCTIRSPWLALLVLFGPAACGGDEATTPRAAPAADEALDPAADAKEDGLAQRALCRLPFWRSGGMFRCPAWESVVDGAEHADDHLVGMSVDPGGALTLVTLSSGVDAGAATSLAVTRLGRDGRTASTARYPLSGEVLLGARAAFDPRGGIYVSGYDFDREESHLVRLDATGRHLWSRRHPGLALEVAATASGAVLTGYFTAAYADDGTLRWSVAHEDRIAHTIAIDSGGDAFVGGFQRSGLVAGRTVNEPMWLARVGAAGLAWEQLAGADGDVTRLVLDRGGDVVLTGHTASATGLSDAVVARVSSAGAIRWRFLFDDPANFLDRGEDVAVDASGDVVATMLSVPVSGRGASRVTVKLAGATGAQRWRTAPASVTGVNPGMNVHRVVTSPRGDVYVTGEGYTVKYDAAGRKVTELRGRAEENSTQVATDGDAAVYLATRTTGRGLDVTVARHASF